MNAKACASSGKNTAWSSIDWKQAAEYVKRLQMRIVKAQKESRYGKVKSLQWLLTHSFYAKALAVKRVTENKGKRTPGVDGEIWSTPNAKFSGIKKLERKGYQPLPLRRTYIKKFNGKMRPLGIPAMRDRAMQTLYKFALEPIAEATADGNSYGFRTGRCVQDALQACYIDLARKSSPVWILEGDIKGCFDHINHNWMLEHIPMDKEILRKFLKCGFVETKRLFPTDEGTPQGGSISPILSNMVLDGLEKAIRAAFPLRKDIGRKAIFPGVHFVRYADDFIVTSKTKETLEKEILPLIRGFLSKRGLQLSEEKTVVTHIDDGFDFLGCNIRKYGGKYLCKPSKKNTKAIMAKIRAVIKRNHAAKQENLIGLLNPIIRGWVNSQKYNVSVKAFERMDFEIWRALWRWALRRHKRKGKNWIARRYFHRVGTRNWTFSTPTEKKTENGNTVYFPLVYAVDTQIRRFTKIKAEANPFDYEWRQYFEERETDKMRNDLKGRKTLLRLWNRQRGICPVCNEKMTVETGVKIHELKARSKAALTLVHPQCHTSIHTLDSDLEPTLEREL